MDKLTDLSSFTFTEPTPFGPASFTAQYHSNGLLASVNSSVAGMSSVMRKLSYGDRAELAGAYFAALLDNIRYRLSILPFLHQAPPPYRELLEQVATEEIPDTASQELIASINFWQHYTKLREALFLRHDSADRALQRMVGNAHRWRKLPAKQLASLEPWVITLFNLVDTNTLPLVWRLLGALGTASAANRLLTELERPGIHPQGAALLQGLEYCFAADRDGERLLKLHARQQFTGTLAVPYLNVVQQIISPEAVAVAKHILFQQVEAAAEAMAVFQANEVENPIQIFREAFQRTEAFWVVFRYVEMFWTLAPREEQITLAELNEKLSQPSFTDTAPVTWQQQLSDSWKALLDQTPAEERLRIVQAYIVRREARLQYNALLQLNYLIRQYPNEEPNQRILQRVQHLVSHRYDKVAAQAIAAARKLVDQMPDWVGLNERVMPISTAPGLRVAKLKLLKQLGQEARVAAAQKDYFTDYIQGDISPDERMVVRSIVKYLRLPVSI